MRRCRLFAGLIGLAAVVAAGSAVLWTPTPRVTGKNFERIRIGMSKTEVEAILGPPGDYRTALGEMRVLSCRDDKMRWYSDSFLKLDDGMMTWAEDPNGMLGIGGKEGNWLGDTFRVSVCLDDSDHVTIFNGYPRRTTQTAFDALAWRLNRQWLRWFPKPEQAAPKRKTI